MQNLSLVNKKSVLYKLNMPENIGKHIVSLIAKNDVCKTLKGFEGNVYGCSIEKLENADEAVEDEQK